MYLQKFLTQIQSINSSFTESTGVCGIGILGESVGQSLIRRGVYGVGILGESIG